ncbi:eukaryotic translation initiation factor 3 subunit A [Aricia agestis]|uniref:eukaryotic translation initiation factor 3 subunit A n=1 Tax=Aricia agestis TaxID=91739 RepID=UPI001C208FC8|nr:eukaryotic translation initiation factor 3 subunit A [Aricia agestis]
MLSAAKVRIHGMQDENWVIKDKINQYRGLIKLYERDRKIHEGDLVRQKKRYFRDIRQLRKDITDKRGELAVAVYGDKQFLRNAFQEHRRLQLTYMNSQADKVLESIHQENFNKRKQLDRIRYLKKKKMEKFRLSQLESDELRDRLLFEVGGKLPAEKKEQAVANYVQRANIKKNAALAIKVMYKKILDILKKDSIYFTVVLEALKQDCRAQGKCLMGATEMGQLAMEYLDDRKFDYNKLEKEIKANMKERERTLKIVRRELTFLTNSFPNLIRKEEVTNLDELYEEEETGSSHSVHWELEEVVGTCKRLQRATLSQSFDSILPRLKDQKHQAERLTIQLRLNSQKRDALLENRQHALLMLDCLKNVGQERTAQYIQDKKKLREQLITEEREEKNLIKSLDERGQLIIEMKTSLQQINHLLSSVGTPNVQKKQGPPPSFKQALDLPDSFTQKVPEVEADLDKLLSVARQKLNVLVQAASKIEMTDTTRANANLFYHNTLSKYMKDNFKEDVVAEAGLIEFEMEDPNVPSHAMIKLRSQQLVDSQVSEFDVPDTKK